MRGFSFVCFSSLFMTSALSCVRVSQSMSQAGDSHEKMKNICCLLSHVIHLPYVSHLFQKRIYGSFHIFRSIEVKSKRQWGRKKAKEKIWDEFKNAIKASKLACSQPHTWLLSSEAVKGKRPLEETCCPAPIKSSSPVAQNKYNYS